MVREGTGQGYQGARQGGNEYILDTNTHTTAFGKGYKVSVQTEFLVGGADPAVGIEGFGIREDGWVHVDEVVGFAYWGLKKDGLVSRGESGWLCGMGG